MKKQFIKLTRAFALGAVLLVGCNDDDEPKPQILAGYTSTSLGLTLADNSGIAVIELSRTDEAATSITLKISGEENAVYGTNYTTEPAATNGEITLEIAAGETSANLVINKLQNPAFEQVISFNITIETISNDGKAGANNVLAVSFEENPTSAGAILAAEVGGPAQPNQVFINLSTQTMTAIDKNSWDLAFSSGTNFRVALNYAAYAMARVTDQTDLAQIDDALVTETYKNEMVGGQVNTEYMDDPTGDLTKTAIAEISATEANNMVYVINRGQLDTDTDNERGFVKIRITQSGSDYVITYGDINDADGFTSVTVAKSTDNDFTYFSFDDGVVDVAPANWDFAMTTFLNEFPSGGDVYSYKYKDFSLTNDSYVKIAAVEVTDMLTYENYSSADLANTTLENNRLGIGSSWRSFDFASFTYAINDAIFYIIEDTDGNNYKLKFTKMLNDQGDRGYPEFVYELL